MRAIPFLMIVLSTFLVFAGCQKNSDIEPLTNAPEEPPGEEIIDYGLDTLGKWTWLDYDDDANVRGHDLIFDGPETVYLINEAFYPYPGMMVSFNRGNKWYPGEGKVYIIHGSYNTIHPLSNDRVVFYERYNPALPGNVWASYPQICALYYNFKQEFSFIYRYFYNASNNPLNRIVQDVESIGDYVVLLTFLGEVMIYGDHGAEYISATSLPESDVISVAFPTKTTGFVGSSKGKLLRTDDGNNSWETILTDPHELAIVEISFFNEKLGFALTNANVLYRTGDGGENWSRITLPHGSKKEDIYQMVKKRVVMVDALRGFTNYDKEVFETLDGGLTWTRSLRVGNTTVNAISYDMKGYLWAVTTKGLIKVEL